VAEEKLGDKLST